jgi:beta-glucoside operon transcriptional antiterminator
MYRIKKVLNVNVVLAEQDNEEYITFGKGIGYHQKVGNTISEKDVSKKFAPVEGGLKSEMIQSLNSIDPVYIEITTEIVDFAEKKLNESLLPNIYYSLTDHLSFAVQRYKDKQVLGNRIYWEMKTYYPEMFEIGEYGLQVLSSKLGVQLPKEEAANIAFHVINASTKSTGKINIIDVTQLMDNVLQTIRTLTGGSIETSGLNYERFITHVKFFAERYLSDSMLSDDEGLLKNVYSLYPEASKIAIKTEKAIVAIYDKELTQEELAYLIIHIHRLLLN